MRSAEQVLVLVGLFHQLKSRAISRQIFPLDEIHSELPPSVGCQKGQFHPLTDHHATREREIRLMGCGRCRPAFGPSQGLPNFHNWKFESFQRPRIFVPSGSETLPQTETLSRGCIIVPFSEMNFLKRRGKAAAPKLDSARHIKFGQLVISLPSRFASLGTLSE